MKNLIFSAAVLASTVASSSAALKDAPAPDLDLILFGATGCVGHLTAQYLAQQDSLKWAIADINTTRLQSLADELAQAGGPSSKPEVITARLDGSTDLNAFVLKARAIATAAGPFSIHDGAALVKACAVNGVNYADVSDEFFWQRKMVDSFDQTARQSGAKIVLAAGFCATAGGLGAQLALEKLGSDCSASDNVTCQVDAWLEKYNGGISAGVEHTPKNASYPPEWNGDPYVLAPNVSASLVADTLVTGTKYPVRVSGEGEIVNNIFGPYDARLLRRSFVLRDQHIHLRVGAQPKMYEDWAAFIAEHPLSWKSLSSCPTKELLDKGSWRYRFIATESENTTNTQTVVLSGAGDPGYHFTSGALAETALCLSGKTQQCTSRAEGGILSPGALFDAQNFSQHLHSVGLLDLA